MGVDSQSVGNDSAAHRIFHDGKCYEFRLVDQNAKADWEKRLYEKACSAAEVMARRKPADWLEAKLLELDNAFLAGDFSLFADGSVKLLNKPAGVELLLSIITGKDIGELAPLLLSKPKEVKAKIHLILRESFPGVQLAEGDDPKN